MTITKTTKTLEHTLKRLRNERRNKQEIINAINNGILIFNADLSLRMLNPCAKLLLNVSGNKSYFFDELKLYKNKKATVIFKLLPWLKKQQNNVNDSEHQQLVWLKHPENDRVTTPVLLASQIIHGDKLESQSHLITVYDRSFEIATDQKNRILDAALNSYDGQFLTNDKGYITHPNSAFSAFTGILPDELNRMTIIHWLEKQVTLKVPVDNVLKTLLEDKMWSGEVQIHPNDETTFYAVLSISMISDKSRNIECYVGTLQDITDIKIAQEELEHLAFYDELTNLPNRRLLLEHLEQSFQHHLRNKTYTALLFLDLDRFKSTNDAFGHAVGDALLVQTADRLKNILRAEDTVARIGGDEFVILSRTTAHSIVQAEKHATKLSQKVINALNEDHQINEHTIRNGVSIGACIFPVNQESSVENIITYSDLAMYEAKHRGRNRIHFYENSLSEDMLARHRLEKALNAAKIETEFELYFQPQFDQTETLVSAETLIRWQHPELGYVSPAKFIPIAEDGRQILKIGDWILEKAFTKARKWHEQYGLQNLSINISPIQFHEANFVQNIQYFQKKTNVKPNIITLELTEGILISDMDQALDKIHQLSDQGFKFSIDDFGTGYSSLSYFQKLPIHELKIDQSFVFRLPNDEDIAIIDTIISLGKSKKLRMVAEGVETQAQVEFFKQKPDPILMQGFFYSKPLSAKKFESSFLAKLITSNVRK